MKRGSYLPIIISVLFIMAPLLLVMPAQATVTAASVFHGVRWEYGEKTVSSVCLLEFENEKMSFASSGEYEDVYNYTYSYNDGTYIYEYIQECNMSQKYDYNTTQYMTGNFSISIDMLCDYVSIRDGGVVSYEWLGAKYGTWKLEQWIEDMSFYSRSNTTYNNSYRQWTILKNATTGEIINPNYNYYEYEYNGNCTYEYNSTAFYEMYPMYANPYDNITGMTYSVDFIIPLQLSTTIFNLTANTKLLWSNFFCEYYLYNDSNQNGIYDLGTSSLPMTGLPTMMYSDEYYGMLIPYACNITDMVQTTINKSTGERYDQDMLAQYAMYGMNTEYPENVDFEAIKNNFTFEWHEPVKNGDNLEFSWAQTVDTIPTMIQIGNPLVNPMSMVQEMDAMDTSYTYGMKVKIDKLGILKTEVNNSFGEVANSTIKDMLSNISLAVPYESVFLATSKVNNSKTIGVPQKASDWLFKIGEALVGELELDNPFKENYSLMDYPTLGANTTFQSQGSSVSKIFLDVGEQPNPQSLQGSNPFASILYTLTDMYDLPSNFKMSISYELVNYPTWEGHRIIHDPIFTVHTMALIDYTEPPYTPLIPGFEFLFILMVIPLIMIVFYRRKNSAQKENLI